MMTWILQAGFVIFAISLLLKLSQGHLFCILALDLIVLIFKQF